MHIPDGFINVPTSAGFGAAAGGGLWYSLRRAGELLDDRRIPLAGLVAAFVFAAQMVNFPVAAGTSGHLIGGVLAGVLVGPWLGSTVLTVVLIVQAVIFTDGGLSALGLNVFNMAILGALGGYLVFAVVRRLLPAGRAPVVTASAIAAFSSVMLAAGGFSIQYAIGGAGGASAGTVAAAMLTVHAVIGVFEGAITALIVAAVMASRPDLVEGAARAEAAGG